MLAMQRKTKFVGPGPPQIVGGRRAAAEFRVEIDLASAETDTGLTFRGPVLPIDDIPDDGECFKVDAETFKKYRLVHQDFVPHF